MSNRDDLEDLLWSEPIDGGAALAASGGDPALADQAAVHRLLRRTVGRHPQPEMSFSFERALARRLRRGASRRPLQGRARVFMTLYWLAVALATGIFLGASDVPVPPLTPWSLAAWFILAPASFLVPSLVRRARASRRWLLS